MTSYDNFAHTFSESRKQMKWEEIEYFLEEYAPFGTVLDVGCGNGRLLGELLKKPHPTSPSQGEEKKQVVILNEVKNPLSVVGENRQSISDSSLYSEGQIFSSYLGIDSSEKLLDEAKLIYNVIPSYAGISDKQGKNSINLERYLSVLSHPAVEGNLPYMVDPKTSSGGQTKFNFQLLDMREISKLSENSLDTIFFIASFHHLETFEERIQVLQDTKKLLKNGGKIFFTNWALESDFNRVKYASSKIFQSENEFGSSDFQIKIGDFQRFYHSFTLKELAFLSNQTGFQIVENRLFDSEKNFITILEK